ncbi:ParB/RepB/Spo0J family partition protein [Microbispora bryophytorum]|uniref:ParB/RepB/Spo0J family partition protein n=1 Tax=Microbispora bryophytorum TaxID=1460882 RepID=UPI0033E138D7
MRIDSLLPADSPRVKGEDTAHAKVLADAVTPLPPILVHRRTMRVIDGMHRVRAAVMRGRRTIEARFFDGPEDAAFLLAVRENIKHGLPLSTADREMAVIRILTSQPHWSDRAIAAATGLSARAVAAIRQRSIAAAAQTNTRMGRDGRVRPIDGAQGRIRASRIISRQPGLSLREIAHEAGISVATAKDVRERLRQGRDPLPERQRNRQGVATATTYETRRDRRAAEAPARTTRPASGVSDWPSVRDKMRKDPALKYSTSGLAFLRWFDTRAFDTTDWAALVGAVPAHWRNEIAELARSYAERWLQVANALEGKSRRTA